MPTRRPARERVEAVLSGFLTLRHQLHDFQALVSINAIPFRNAQVLVLMLAVVSVMLVIRVALS
jgi:hypothetical protein